MDICESLMYSWLKHIKGCQIIELNWKSAKEWDLKHENELNEILQKCVAYFQNTYNFKLVDKQKLMQKLKQCECDVIGIKRLNSVNEYFAVETAFHAEGLYYTEGSKDGTEKKVVQKMVSLALCLYGFFDTKEGEIYFTSPHITGSKEKKLKQYVNDLQTIFKANGYAFNFKLLFDKDFNEEIIKPIKKLKKQIGDANEMFARASILLDMMEKYN